MVLRFSTSIRLRNTLLLLLTCAAGYVDAIGYQELDRVFTANMTGNTVLLGLALVEADSPAALRSGLALAGFLVGGALGACVVERSQPANVWPLPVTVALTLEWGILLAFAIGWLWSGQVFSIPTARAVLIVLSAAAMGVQSAAVRRLDVSGIATTYLTGTLTTCVARFVSWVHRLSTSGATPALGAEGYPGQPLQPSRSAAFLAAVWLVYLGGAGGAAAAPMLGPVLTLTVPLALLLVVLVVAAVAFWPRSSVLTPPQAAQP
jgi:uncharacterized membrane protein YoaK (UPF0700 family)